MTTPSAVNLTEGTVNPPTPPSGELTLFTKTDDKLYSINSSGTVVQVGASTSPAGSTGDIQGNDGAGNFEVLGNNIPLNFFHDTSGTPFSKLTMPSQVSGEGQHLVFSDGGQAQIDGSAASSLNLIGYSTEIAMTNNIFISAGAGRVFVRFTDLAVSSAGHGLQIAQGGNARIGTDTLISGTVTISNTSVTATTNIHVNINGVSGTPGNVQVTNIIPGTSFDINSYDGTGALQTGDNSTVVWTLIERI